MCVRMRMSQYIKIMKDNLNQDKTIRAYIVSQETNLLSTNIQSIGRNKEKNLNIEIICLKGK